MPPPQAPPAPDSDAARLGAAIFERVSCADCHIPPLFTSPDVHSVGVADELGQDEFDPPSLRGVALRPRLFHDGRYRSLEELLSEANHPGTECLDEQSSAKLAAYLRTLQRRAPHRQVQSAL